MSELLRTAVIGCGGMGQAHCLSIEKLVPEMQLAAVCDADPETAQTVGEKFGVPSFSSVHDLLVAGLAEAAVIATPHPLHLEMARPCLEAGLHVLCEKPLTEKVSTADELLQCAERQRRVLGINFQMRFDPAVRHALEVARSGGLGQIHRTHLVVTAFRSQVYFDSNPWRATWRGEGGGVLINQAPHLLDFFTSLVGLPQSVLGRTETRMHQIEVEDTAEALLRYQGGGSGYIYCSTTEPAGSEGLEIHGENGCLRFRNGTMQYVRYPAGVAAFAQSVDEVWGKPPAEEPIVCGGEPELNQKVSLANFARHILFEEPLLCDARSGLLSLELANAITLSGILGKEVSLPLDRAAYDAVLEDLRLKSTLSKKQVAVRRESDPRLL